MNRVVTFLLVLAACFSFWLSSKFSPHLLNLRKEYRLDQADPLHNTPPLVAFTTVALGGFRGILADILWLRASILQDRGEYFEIVQLSDWITKLEPRFSQIWAFHAWNMAYNISVLFEDPADRWRWVRHGVSLLRDEGLLYNPADAQLYRELGWLFEHKLGEHYDEADLYYKKAWAAEMIPLMNGPRPDYAALAGARPETPAALTKATLTGTYKLDPAAMQEIDAHYGPLDWRLPQAHALYWAWQGRKFADGFELTAADRMICQSLAQAFREGRLFLDPAKNLFIPSPNLDLLDGVLKAYAEALQRRPDDDTFKTGRENFMKDALVFLYAGNRESTAQGLLSQLRTAYPQDQIPGDLGAFVYQLFTGNTTNVTRDIAMSAVETAASQGYYWTGLGDTERGTGFDHLARLSYDRYSRSLPANAAATNRLPRFEEIEKKAREDTNAQPSSAPPPP